MLKIDLITKTSKKSIRADWAITARDARRALASCRRAVAWVFSCPGRALDWLGSLPWEEQLAVRKGFLVGALAGFSIVGSTLWALSSLSYLPGRPPEPVFTEQHLMPMARISIPAELAWFFIQYPYVSESAQIRQKNHHSYVITDNPRKKQYVITLGQHFRRVEIYAQDADDTLSVHLFMPGTKRTVWFKGPKVIGQSTVPDGNLWMWRSPLWNPLHLKIYGMADLWLDSPFKRYSCAGFVHKFLKDAGVNVPILDAWDMAKQPWVRVPSEELEPGDIITIKAGSARHRRFWGHNITHVGVYVGHGKFIHAATASPRARRSWVRMADMEDFRHRIDKILRPPELL